MAVNEVSDQIKLVELVKKVMRDSGMNIRSQIGKFKGPVTSRAMVDGVI